jgi:hypothetical protein
LVIARGLLEGDISVEQIGGERRGIALRRITQAAPAGSPEALNIAGAHLHIAASGRRAPFRCPHFS